MEPWPPAPEVVASDQSDGSNDPVGGSKGLSSATGGTALVATNGSKHDEILRQGWQKDWGSRLPLGRQQVQQGHRHNIWPCCVEVQASFAMDLTSAGAVSAQPGDLNDDDAFATDVGEIGEHQMAPAHGL